MLNRSRGKFENRSVAVKRILPDCFSFANNEVIYTEHLLCAYHFTYKGSSVRATEESDGTIKELSLIISFAGHFVERV